MADREFVYVEMEDGKKVIATDDKGLPLFNEVVDGEGDEPKTTQRSADVFHLLGKVHELGSDLRKVKDSNKSMKDFNSLISQKGILSEEDFSTGEATKKFNDWINDAVDAQEKIKSLGGKDLTKIKDMEEMKSQLEKARDEKINQQKDFYNGKLSESQNVIDRQRNQINKLMIHDKFNTSKFIKDNCGHIPVDVIANTFANKFKLSEENGEYSVVGYKSDGKEIYSQLKVGDMASFDEALEEMIKEHPSKDFFLGGAIGNGTGGGAGRNSISSIDAEIEEARKRGDTQEVIRLKRVKKEKQNNG